MVAESLFEIHLFALDLLQHPGRGECLGGGYKNEELRLAKPLLQRGNPALSRTNGRAVEKNAARSKDALEVAIEHLDPVGVAG